MKHRFAVTTAGCAAMLAAVVGCSSEESGSAGGSQSGEAKVTFGSNDAGPVTSVGCETKDGFTTINIEGSLHTTVIVTDGEAPAVESVSIGEVGTDKPSLAYIEGLSSQPVVASRDAKSYTITGTGAGTDAANPGTPVDMPFDIAVTCP
ncbi:MULTISPECIES: lipoprotein LpqH [Mycolicibacterium]|uniref:lipoprotein LpqH n=1 Tax=Mycolicibacterium TaxID=1866885 RepID=UPI001F2D8FE1|nr:MULTISPECIES: lipoprotein LpqH [Mycolicibacterium]